MPTLTIPKEMTKKEDELVLVPRNEYKTFLQWRKTAEQPRKFKTFKPTHAEKKALVRARKNLAEGRFITLEQLRHELGLTHRE